MRMECGYVKFTQENIPEHPTQGNYDPCSKQDLHLVLCSTTELQHRNVFLTVIN